MSYGRADAAELALKLAADLEREGYAVWLDKHQIRAGRDWQEEIEKALLASDVVVALLTPHAVRRPQGVCLDEISFARSQDRRVLPAMVIPCQPPLAIFRLDWVDLQEWKLEGRYQSAFERLLRGLEREEDPVEGTHAWVAAQLQPLSFDVELGRLTRNFTGREWLMREMEAWLADDTSRVFLVTGDPGTGKSAMLAHLAERHPKVGAFHFCRFALPDTRSPRGFVRSIAAQLASQLDDYRAALVERGDLERLAREEPEAATLLKRLVADPLARVRSREPLLIVVDALDEARTGGERGIVELLRDGLRDLPRWVRLVVSARKEPWILDALSEYTPHPIEADRAENLDDVRSYVSRRLDERALAARLTAAGASPARVQASLVEKSAGNFLYVVKALEAIERGQLDPARPEAFPAGLIGLYQEFFERIFATAEAFEAVRPYLDVLCAAREPIPAERIAACIGEDPFDIAARLEPLEVFFPLRDGCHAPFHKSIVDWLSGLAGKSRTYRVNVARGHTVLADALLGAFREGRERVFEELPERFVLAHLPAHLNATERWDDLVETLCDICFVEAKVRAGLVFGLQEDYERALGALPENRANIERERERKARLERYARDLVEYARKVTAERKRLGEGGRSTQELAAFSKVELAKVEIPKSVRMWTDEEIEAERLRAIEHPTRLDRLEAFAQFVRGQVGQLAAYGKLPCFTVQQAYNSANGGPVAEAAARVVVEHAPGGRLLCEMYRPPPTPRPTTLRTLQGHTGIVSSVAVTPDAARAVSASSDHTLRVWDLDTGDALRTLRGHTSMVTSVAVTPDGARAVSASRDNTLRLWDLETGDALRTLRGHTSMVTSVAVTPDGARAVSASWDDTLRVWDLDTGDALRTLQGHTGWVLSVAVTPDGGRAVSASSDHTLRVWDLATGDTLRTLQGHSGWVSSVAVTPDGARAVVASYDDTLRVWDLQTGHSLRTLRGHTSMVTSVAVTPDGARAVSASWDDTLRVWDLDTGDALRILQGHTDSVESVAVTPDGARAVSASRDRALRVWDLDTGDARRTLQGHTDRVTSVAITPDGARAVSTSDDHTLRVWDLDTGDARRILQGHTFEITNVAVTPDGARAVSASSDHTLPVWDLDTGDALRTLQGHTGSVESVAVTPDGGRAVSASSDHTLRVWDLDTGDSLGILQGHTDSVESVAVTPDGARAVSASRDNTLRVWDLETGSSVCTLEGHTAGVLSVAVTPDGARAVSASSDKTLRVWDLATGDTIRTLKGHTDWVRRVAITPDEARAVSASDDHTLRVWDLETGDALVVLAADAPLGAVVVSPVNPPTIIAGDSMGRVHFIRLIEPASQRSR